MNENIQNFNFLKDTVQKFKGEVQKMLSGTPYSTTGVVQLKNTLDEIEKNITSQEKVLASNYLNQRKAQTANHRLLYQQQRLPLISQPLPQMIQYMPEDEVYTTIKYAKQSTLDRLKSHRNQRKINEEKMQYIINMKNRRPKGKIAEQNEYRQNQFNSNKQNSRLLAKYDIYSKGEFVKVTNKMPNFMDSEKRFKYSVLNKKFCSNEVLFDKNKQPIIRKEELDKGLLNMIYKGLIPKGADLSPAFESNGNPLQLNPNFKDDFTKIKGPDDIESLDNTNINKIDLNRGDGFFITKPEEIGNLNNVAADYENNKEHEVEEDDEEYKKRITTPSELITEMNADKNLKQLKRKVLIFSNYTVIKNEEYKNFYSNNQEKWGAILYLFEHLSKLFKKLNITTVEVYQDKILELAEDEMKIIQNKDLLLCITEKDLLEKGLDPNNPLQLYTSIKEKFVIKIQMAVRKFFAKQKLKNFKKYFDKIKLIQHTFLSSKLIYDAKIKARNLFEERYTLWLEMMNKFKTRWELIKAMPRVEIHFNNISPNTPNSIYLNTTINKFTEKENNQLNRIINLVDPMVEIIYISPYPLNNDILSYYFSIMTTLGVENVKERFHVLVPEYSSSLPPHFSISQLLLLSTNTLKEIKAIVGERESYIIPGKNGKTEVELSILLDIPILMGDLFQSDNIFTKSGSKLIFEANEINMPVSVWDIKEEETFFKYFSHLVAQYPEYDTWIFKMDNECNGRGIAYLQLDRIQQYVDLKKDSYKYEDKSKYESAISEILQKNIAKKVKIVTNYLYKSWDEYFNNFIMYRGIIESCPYNNPSLILGNPCIPILIEPNGNIEHLPTYDKINLYNFRNIGAISPQKLLPLNELDLIANKIGKNLYEYGIIGYVTIELIVFKNESNLDYYAIDLSFGLNDILSSIKFCHFLYSHALDKFNFEANPINLSLNQDKSLSVIYNNKFDIFTFPFFAHPNISYIKINDLVKSFREDNLIFDVERKKGIIFNFSDVLQCGNMGICGLINNEDIDNRELQVELWKIIQNSFNIISSAAKTKDFLPSNAEDCRTDMIDINSIIEKINKFTNNLIAQVKRLIK